MNEKEGIKISLSTFFLILSLIVIIVMSIFIYKFYNEKIEATKVSTELQTQVNSLSETVNNLQSKINNVSETINNNSLNESTSFTKEYEITGTYYQENAQGDEPSYTFSSNNKVNFGSLWTCSGTYTVSDNTIKIIFTNAVDPDGNKADFKDYGVKESVELTILDDNNLKDSSNGIIYSK